MTKTKKIIVAAVAFIAAALILLGIRYSDKFLPDNGTSEDTGTTTANFDNLTVGDYTTIKPFADAQTEILTPTTVKAPGYITTERYDEHATRLSEENGWKDNELTDGLPKIKTGKVSTVNYISDKGRRTVIRIDSFDYNSYLNYIEKLEKAGFKDNNSHAHIPQNAPSTVAMFYSKFDGERSFGVYWYGDSSSAGFDCEIVISDYDQAK